MAGLFQVLQRIFGGKSRGRTLALARSAELRGELARAADLFERAGRSDEAMRVRRSRALAVLAGAAAVPVTASRRPEVIEAAADLEALGDFARAAEGYGYAHDVDGQARALARAGEVERLDELLEGEQARTREVRARRKDHDDFDAFVADGRRREAVELARASADPALRERGAAVEAQRLRGPLVRARLRGESIALVLGNPLIVGRGPDVAEGEGALAIPSPAVSRRHLTITRLGDEVVARDLGSHNGTSWRGAPLEGEVAVAEGIELRLGDEVPIAIGPARALAGAVAVDVAGHQYVAALGPAALGIGGWRLEQAAGGWIELVTGDAPPAYGGALRLASRVTLLGGDAIAADPGGEAVLRFEA